MQTGILKEFPVALTIGGSDSGGGAGIQADLKTFAFHQVHGSCAVTCVTAQNTTGVSRIDALSPDSVLAQIEAVRSDMGVSAVKTGMLLNQEIINAVADMDWMSGFRNVVVDPVMVSRAGDKLLDDNAIDSIANRLLPLSSILTPNRYEAELLAGMTISSRTEMEVAAERICSLGASFVLVKGGGMDGELCGVDIWCDGKDTGALFTQCVDTANTHGTGCTLSAAITANLAMEMDPLKACTAAKAYVTDALKHSLNIGKGKGPVGHFYSLSSQTE